MPACAHSEHSGEALSMVIRGLQAGTLDSARPAHWPADSCVIEPEPVHSHAAVPGFVLLDDTYALSAMNAQFGVAGHELRG